MGEREMYGENLSTSISRSSQIERTESYTSTSSSSKQLIPPDTDTELYTTPSVGPLPGNAFSETGLFAQAEQIYETLNSSDSVRLNDKNSDSDVVQQGPSTSSTQNIENFTSILALIQNLSDTRKHIRQLQRQEKNIV